MKLTALYLTKNACYKAGKTITPKGIMVHSTGANNPNLKRYVGPDDGVLGVNTNGNHWNTDKPEGKSICPHAFIGLDKNGIVRTYQTLPWNFRGWHCGKDSKGSGNDTHISFEICEDALKDSAYFKKVYQESVDLCAHLCKKYNLDPLKDGVLICHSEGYKRGIASNHSDVMHWFPKFGKSMDTFRKDVKAALSASDAPKKENIVVTPKYPVPTVNLKKGSKGNGVKWLQTALNTHGYRLTVDGVFGIMTDRAVRNLQKTKKLQVDGIVGPKTRGVLT